MSFSMLKGIHRRMLGITERDKVVAPYGFAAGGDGQPGINYSAPNTVAAFEDFIGDTGAHNWTFVHGDTGTGHSGVVVTGTNGLFRLTHQNQPLNLHSENLAITQGLMKQWKVNQGKPKDSYLRLGARVKLENISRTADRIHAFIGFSDSGGAEMPVYDTGAGMISNAADLVGFYFGAGADTGWSGVSVKSTAGDSGDQLVVLNSSPTANTYDVLEVEIRTGLSDTGGRAHFYVNGVKKGTIDSPVGSAIALTPWIGIWGQDTGDQFMDIDWIAISAPRDTGL